MKLSRFLLAIPVLALSAYAADEQTVAIKTTSIENSTVLVNADLQGKPTELECQIRLSSCSQPQPGEYRMRPATADEAIYTDCTNVVLVKSSGVQKVKVGVYCWLNATDCYLVQCSTVQVETIPAVISDNQVKTFTGYPPNVYMRPFMACASNEHCAQTNKFHLDQLPTGCCVLIVSNGDGQGRDEVRSYELFLNGERVVARGHLPSAQAVVKLRPTNTLKVILTGAPHSKVFVLVAYDSSQPK